MPRLGVIFLYFFMNGCTEGKNIAERYGNPPPLKWSNGEHKIGEGVTLKAYIFFDTDDYETQATEKNVTKYFTAIFTKAQEHFHNNSVMISIEIRNISKNTDLEVWEASEKALDGNATLKRLQNYSQSIGLTNDSIVYLYTEKTPVDKAYMGAAIPGVFSTFSTFGTFCSNVNSAAIVVQKPGNCSYWKTVKATTPVFGTRHFIQFTEDDIKTMNKTFSRCHVNKKMSKDSEGK
ncbi:uncharacterized protein LOC119464864 [Dermacentor silvarum]|uniref:uncharacterized protein LOC119464864 n=1 Tax=Dermacentor silvarum TaxID=543639 RepID=UPI00189B5583|nr:uncharacterized protein LOC119464864 [Dermacentor silvarum]